MTLPYDKEWAYARLPLPTTNPTIDLLIENDDKMLELVLQLTNTYLNLQAQVNQQKRVISMQESLINQCMERIMTLEGRSVLGNFNQRLEQLELHAIGPNFEWDCIRDRLDKLESWLYTHDYAYFQEQEKGKEVLEDETL